MTIFRPDQKALLGNKVYSGGRNSPTQGRVNPQGYIDREKRNQAQKKANAIPNWKRGPWMTLAQKNRGPDGQSDSRSGLAQQALKNAQQKQPNRVPMQPGTGAKLPSKQQPDTPVGIPSGEVATPVMNTSPCGQLALPYDDDFTFGLLEQQQGVNSGVLDLQMQQQQQAAEFARAMRDAGKDYEGLKRNTLNSAAGRGMAYSSGYGHDVAENANAYNTYLGDLEQNNTMFNQHAELQRTQLQNALNDWIRQATFQQGRRNQEQAGDLGFGQDGYSPTQPPPQVPGAVNSDKRNGSNLPGPHDRIQRLAQQGLNKQAIVAKLTGTKKGSGGASELNRSQLKAIGFSNDFIKKVTDPPKPKAQSKSKKKGK